MSSGAQRFMELTATALELCGTGQAIHVWPISATEQHGPHLPNGTDAYILEALRDQVVDELGDELLTIWLPHLVFGSSSEHIGLPGTLSLSPRTMMAVIDDVCSSLHSAGVTNIAFLNGHGGNVGMLTVMAREIRHKYGMRTYTIRPLAMLGAPTHGGLDMHAGELETSVMLALRPDLVVRDRIPDTMTTARSETALAKTTDVNVIRSLGWVTGDLSYNGVIGDAASATAQAGEALVRRMIAFLADELRRFARIVALDREDPQRRSSDTNEAG